MNLRNFSFNFNLLLLSLLSQFILFKSHCLAHKPKLIEYIQLLHDDSINPKDIWNTVRKVTSEKNKTLETQYRAQLNLTPWNMYVLVRPGEKIGHEYLLLLREHKQDNVLLADVMVADFVPNIQFQDRNEVIDFMINGASIQGKIRASWLGAPLWKIIVEKFDRDWSIISLPHQLTSKDIEGLKQKIENEQKLDLFYQSFSLAGRYNCESWINHILNSSIQGEESKEDFSYGFTNLILETREFNRSSFEN